MGKLFGQLQGDNFILATRFFFIQNFIFQKKATKVLDVAPQGMSLKKIHRRHMSKFSLQKLAILKVKQFQFEIFPSSFLPLNKKSIGFLDLEFQPVNEEICYRNHHIFAQRKSDNLGCPKISKRMIENRTK